LSVVSPEAIDVTTFSPLIFLVLIERAGCVLRSEVSKTVRQLRIQHMVSKHRVTPNWWDVDLVLVPQPRRVEHVVLRDHTFVDAPDHLLKAQSQLDLLLKRVSVL